MVQIFGFEALRSRLRCWRCCLPPAAPAEPQETPPLPHQQWSFDGVFGTYDRAAMQRGFQVYKQVCSACHPVEHLISGDLAGARLYARARSRPSPRPTRSPTGRTIRARCIQRPGRSSGPDPRPVSERQGGARGKRRRASARSVADRQRARRRRRLCLRDPERFQAAASRVHRSAGEILQRVFPRASDRDAAAAQRWRSDLCRRDQGDGAADGARCRHLLGLGFASPISTPAIASGPRCSCS